MPGASACTTSALAMGDMVRRRRAESGRSHSADHELVGVAERGERRKPRPLPGGAIQLGWLGLPWTSPSAPRWAPQSMSGEATEPGRGAEKSRPWVVKPGAWEWKR